MTECDQILAFVDDAPRQVTEWGVTFYVRALAAKERDEFEISNTYQTGKHRGKMKANVRARLVALCAVNDAGERIFSDEKIEALGSKSSARVDRVFEICRELSHIGSGDWEEDAKN